MQPGDAFTGLEAGDSSIGADAFTIGGTTFDPITSGGTRGLRPRLPDSSVHRRCWRSAAARPTLAASQFALAPQDFNVYDGTGASATEVGKHRQQRGCDQPVGLDQHGVHRRQVSPARPRICRQWDRSTTSSTSATGSRTSTPRSRASSGAADTVTDTLVTPWGDLNLDSLVAGIDAASALDPGDAFTAGLDAATEAATSAASAIDPLSFLGL